MSGLLLAGCLLSGPAWLPAAEPDPSAMLRDLLHTVQARRALSEDPQLADLNLGVKVTKRRAVIWGPVPSVEIAERAVRRLKQIVELIDIRNETTVLPPDTVDMGPPRPQYLPETLPTAPPPPPVPVISPTAGNQQRTAQLQQPSAFNRRLPATPARPSSSSRQRENEVVLPSLRVPLPLPEEPETPPEPPSLEAHIRELQRTHLRFQGIRVEVRDRLVYLQPGAGQGDAARDLARRVATISGVDGVFVAAAPN